MLAQRLEKLEETKPLKEQVDAVLKARLKPWLDEAYTVTRYIEGNLVNLQETQQKL